VIGSFVLMNLLEGFAFGVLTFPMMSIYIMLALGGFIAEQYSGATMLASDSEDEWQAYPV
jgi:hypothetical protein